MSATIRESIERAAVELKLSGAEAVYIFGSAARGTMRDDSDIDFAVSGLPPDKFFTAFSLASGLFDRPIHLIDLDEVTPFTRYLKEEGELQHVG